MKKNKKIKLGVNVDHIATLRQVRGGTTSYPDLLHLVNEAISGGAEQITIHLREDRRHIQLEDLKTLSKKCSVPLNLEMAVTPQMLRYAIKYKPAWCCFVPEKRAELTTEGGLDVVRHFGKIKEAIAKLQPWGIEISLFIAPSLEQVRAAWKAGADAVEFHTGHWVLWTGQRKQKEWVRLVEAAELASSLSLKVHAGHGLDYSHTQKVTQLPHLQEVNIGHSLICYSLEQGLKASVKKMKKILNQKS